MLEFQMYAKLEKGNSYVDNAAIEFDIKHFDEHFENVSAQKASVKGLISYLLESYQENTVKQGLPLK